MNDLSQRNRDDTAAYLAEYLKARLYISTNWPNRYTDMYPNSNEIDSDVLADYIRNFYDTLP